MQQSCPLPGCLLASFRLETDQKKHNFILDYSLAQFVLKANLVRGAQQMDEVSLSLGRFSVPEWVLARRRH